MTDQRDPNDPADDLEGFESFEEPMEGDQMLEDEPMDDAALDADFQDLPEDDVDADVFGEGEPEPAPAKKKTNWFNIGVAVVAIVVAGGLVWSKLGPTLLGSSSAPTPLQSMSAETIAKAGPADSNSAAQQALAPTLAPADPNAGGLLDDPEKFSTLAQNAKPVDAPGEEKAPVIVDPFAGLPNAPTQAAQAEVNAGVPMPAPISAAPATPALPAQPAPVTPPAQAAVTTPLPTPPLATTPTEPQPPVAVVQTTETVMPAPIPEMPAQPVMADAGNGDVADKMAAMENRMNAMEAKIDTAVEKLENAAPVDDSKLAAISSALERLEARLDTMGNAPRQAAARSSDDTPAPVKRASAPKKSKPKAQPSAYDEPYTPPSQAVNVSTGSGGSGWELRGATNGRAIIAKGNDIREVGVGDTVPGMGQITGVAQVGGVWVVQGTMSRLSQ